ncbi:unnamed protein product [Darwinula stevensoni]|uniref:Ras-GEF domain-containing protein n=1 Tax=Darwinula stevensoni TaxID=69355 RepID=A0A7R8XH05_9CRUS|nr:unnamed protein product [Darwinula stevensoni]CAG0893038.1 unnamed protein product [Darwinula stevensoni]
MMDENPSRFPSADLASSATSVHRCRSLSHLVAVTVLYCNQMEERVEMLNRWTEVAEEAKSALGNLLGFSSIMHALGSPHIQRLKETMHAWRQRFTDKAFQFEARLRPTLDQMEEGRSQEAPNTTVPYLLPLCYLADGWEAQDALLYWERGYAEAGLPLLYRHLSAARDTAANTERYARNAKVQLGDMRFEDIPLDMFRTQFHLKFLWGSSGATADARERHTKFQQILSALSRRCEPDDT